MQGANSDIPITPCSDFKADIFRPAMKAAINPNSKSTVFETNLKESPRDSEERSAEYDRQRRMDDCQRTGRSCG
jgi:hypothetical protein